MKREIKTKGNIGIGKILVVVMVVFVLLLSSLQIVLSSQMATSGEKIVSSEAQIIELSEENTVLEREIARLSSLRYIEQQAREQLGMVDSYEKLVFISPYRQLASQK